MKRILFFVLVFLFIGFAIGYVLWFNDKEPPIFKNASASSENTPLDQIIDSDNEEEIVAPAIEHKSQNIKEIEELLMSQNEYDYISREKAVELYGDKLIQLPNELSYTYETTGNYFADTNLEEGKISVGQYWIDADRKKVIMVREFAPSKDAIETFEEHLKLSLDNKDNPIYDYPFKLSEDVYTLIGGPYTEFLDGSPFEPSWIKSMIHAYWIKDDIGITVTSINIEEENEFEDILIKINNQI